MLDILLECSETSLRYKKSHSSFDLIGPGNFFTWLSGYPLPGLYLTTRTWRWRILVVQKMRDRQQDWHYSHCSTRRSVYVVIISRWTNLDCLTTRKVGNRVRICGTKFIIYKTPLNLKWTLKGELMNMRVEWNRSTVIWYIHIFIFGIFDRLCTRKFYGWGVWGRL